MLALMEAIAAIKAFLDQGGTVLLWIAALTFVMWTLIFERVWYFKGGLKGDVQEALDAWEARPERKSWNAHQVRYALISRVGQKINANMDMIATMVSLCPLLGLLGTVTGMIEVFNVLAMTGGGDAKQMAGGVSKATIPTMAGMVAALSGVFANTYLTRTAERENQLFADHLTMDH
ncbi:MULTISPECIES: MotA/TolQ/ExbB proton channel family protein [Gilvimarinus]|uniref:MotA/TolQ/ExbB proton channel family protein n=1 Tax=Gilvimarinus xylanilyticus TaxID=2944139 RepID=A0A9X2I8H3_9GAMM|nr:MULTISPECIES: MotA/TolQ/ExbB proton channel family protein [Gilvimarinus]MCP8900707.1 MotA/TolQ/ExbB proton channel family protein [Gilvimarinus xylanilyticus]UTF61689.1 MotA/TolQ/ExbB proton channel family protein [Gilvimarinus sp. DA14]